ncbi:MAG TPA: DUF5996 family protein [Candidatus Dormibacteraeota bacterium]|jgi:hypothetical protein|nr:DUF5996 family protein [Candidatus Dormibacteraeota bacterium]
MGGRVDSRELWPELPYDAWKDTLDTLHMNLQIVGKVRLALTPLEPQWANVPLYLTSRGMTTTPMACGGLIFQIDVDLIDHQVLIATAQGEIRRVALTSRPVADFHAEFMSNLAALGIVATFRPIPDEVSDPIPFAEDTVHSTYEPEWANRFWRVLSRVDLVLKEHRARYRGRTSPVEFFWGSFDLAIVRFSGRAIDPPPGAGLLERVGGDAEQICAGFWPGHARFPRPAFFAYTYPKPDGIEEQAISPPNAGWNSDLGEFALEYDDVRKSASPRDAILQFCESTYAAGARLRGWDPTLVIEPHR